MDNRFLIWGLSEKSERILYHIGEKNVSAFITGEIENRQWLGKPVISLDEYVQDHRDDIIILAPPLLDEGKVIDELSKNNIKTYFSLVDCPGEIHEPFPRANLKNYIISTCKSSDKIAIYGINFYSLLIYQWIIDNLNKEVLIVSNIDSSSELYLSIAKRYPVVAAIDFIRTCNCSEYELYNSTEENIGQLFKNKIIDLFDCSNVIKCYHNEKIEKIQNVHTGESCVIVATGPSLTYEDLDFLKENGITTISMNRIWTAFNNTEWRPTYYVVQDHRYINEDLSVLNHLTSSGVFVADTSEKYFLEEHPDNHYLFHTHFEYKMDSMPKFSDDFSTKNYNGATVTYTCIQLAVYMGFKNIILLGVDFNFKGNYMDPSNHFTPNYFKTGDMFPGFFQKANYFAYLAAKEYADNHGINIYNATRGGCLEVFERINMSDILEMEVYV